MGKRNSNKKKAAKLAGQAKQKSEKNQKDCGDENRNPNQPLTPLLEKIETDLERLRRQTITEEVKELTDEFVKKHCKHPEACASKITPGAMLELQESSNVTSKMIKPGMMMKPAKEQQKGQEAAEKEPEPVYSLSFGDSQDFTFQPEMVTNIEEASKLQKKLKNNLRSIQYFRTHYKNTKKYMETVKSVMDSFRTSTDFPTNESKILKLNDLLLMMPYSCLGKACNHCKRRRGKKIPHSDLCDRNGPLMLMMRAMRIELMIKEFLIGKKYSAITTKQVFSLYNETITIAESAQKVRVRDRHEEDLRFEAEAKATFYHAIVASRLNFMEESMSEINDSIGLMGDVLARIDDGKVLPSDKAWKEDLTKKIRIQHNMIITKFKRKLEEIPDVYERVVDHKQIERNSVKPPENFYSMSSGGYMHPALNYRVYDDATIIVTATADIPPGQVIMKEFTKYKTFTNFARSDEEKDWMLRRCLTCLEITYILGPCPNCSNGLFCCRACLVDHQKDCMIAFLPRLGQILGKMEFFRNDSPAIAKHAALVMKIITSHDIDFFMERYKEEDSEERKQHQKELYYLIAQTNEHRYTYRLARMWTEYAMYMLNILRDGGYFKNHSRNLPDCEHMHINDCFDNHRGQLPSISEELTMDEFVIFQWLFRLFVVVNKYSLNIEEVGSRADCLGKLFNPKVYHFTRPIGKALFASIAAAFRHVCNPNCFVICGPGNGRRADMASVVTQRTIPRGEEITISYGFDYFGHSKTTRKFLSKFKFGVPCSCLACKDDWDFDELPEGDKLPRDSEKWWFGGYCPAYYGTEAFDFTALQRLKDVKDSSMIASGYAAIKYAKAIVHHTMYKEMESNDQLLYMVRLSLKAFDGLFDGTHYVYAKLMLMLVHMLKMRELSPDSLFTSECSLDKLVEDSAAAWINHSILKHAAKNMILAPTPGKELINSKIFQARETNVAKQHGVAKKFRTTVPKTTCESTGLVATEPIPHHPYLAYFRAPRKTVKLSMDKPGLSAKSYEYQYNVGKDDMVEEK